MEEYSSGSYQTPAQVQEELRESANQIVSVIADSQRTLDTIRSELRGEQLYEDPKTGTRRWVQVDKPLFVKLDKSNKPIWKKNEITKRREYICNDEGVNSIMNILKFSGLNSITPFTNIDEEEIIADLNEIESKIAVLLALKRKEWGLTKAEYPIAVSNLKVIVKDARYRAKHGTILRVLRTITHRTEHSNESDIQRQKKGVLR